MQNQPALPQKSAREKIGWRYMMAGFGIIVLAGVTYYLAPRSSNPVLYSSVGNYLMAAGLVVYVVGRILRWRGRSSRIAQEKP